MGKFDSLVMQQGDCNAPTTMMRAMHQERILGALMPCSGVLTPALWQLPLEPLVP